MQNKMNLCMRKVYDTDVSQMRLEVFKIVAVDLLLLSFKKCIEFLRETLKMLSPTCTKLLIGIWGT